MAEDGLPLRASRGKRYRRVLAEEDEADEEFWGQDFFQEEEKDDAYLTESEKESVADSDFSEAETEGSYEEAEEPTEQTKKKRLLPPGAVQKSQKRTKVKEEVPVIVKEKAEAEVEISPVTLRQSTLMRRTAAEEERRLQEIERVKRNARSTEKVVAPAMGLEEFLKEVAEMEAMNLASLNELEAFEEESKKRALQTKVKKKTPAVKIRSRRAGETEKTVMELVNMKRIPGWLKRRSKPNESEPLCCVMTGLPAKYRDPLTKLPYATAEAFRAIRQRYTTPIQQWSNAHEQQQPKQHPPESGS